MPSTLSYPGVYIEEIPSGVHAITGVATSVAAFIDYFSRGPTNKPVHIFSMADFDREFGGLDPKSEGSYAVQQFFLNGGTEAWVVRVVTTGDIVAINNAFASSVQIGDAIGGGNALLVTAISEGTWGENLRTKVDVNGVAAGEFNLTISEVSVSGGRVSVVRQEIFRNLSMVSTKRNFVSKVVNDTNTGSKLVRVSAPGANRPLANGTFSEPHTANPTVPVSPTVSVTIGVTAIAKLNFPATVSLPSAQPLSVIAPILEAAIRAALPANPAFAGATVGVAGNQLFILAGGDTAANIVTFANDGTNTAAADLKLFGGTASPNSQAYVLGGGLAAGTAQLAGGVHGADGVLPGSAAIIGDLASKRGIYALEDVDLFNILCLPRAAIVTGPDQLSASQAQALISVAETYCEKRRAFLLIDTPTGVDEPQEITNWLLANGSLRHRNAALFYPRVRVPDPLDDFRLRSFGASGTVAGVFARTDSTRGVWKAPAGTEAVTRNVSELEDVLSDLENGALNPLAINCLRNFPVYGNIVWGSRTLDGSNQQASEWKYISVRRTALFIEESLFRGSQWVVFEPNDEPLWAQIRLNLGAFMHNLFRQGAFQGTTPKDAYFVKCDKETTTQNDIDLGVVNIVVGFAPLKPAEFVVIKLQQIAGQIAV